MGNTKYIETNLIIPKGKEKAVAKILDSAGVEDKTTVYIAWAKLRKRLRKLKVKGTIDVEDVDAPENYTIKI
ncbi:hypothetical protein CL617_00570 [archaeon]|nr:hypothetical protein [archaeon]|tara:strand:+ start:34 stop:249 length:216 start_codon:yes stop_codon:yes gene_type:complete